MGTDRSLIADKSCPCGKGKIIVHYCTPDHPWPTKSRWLESQFDCQACSERYALEDRSDYAGNLGPIVIVDRRDVAARESRRLAFAQTQTAFMSSSDVQNLEHEFIQLLEEQPSVAAVHRLLERSGFHVGTAGTFRRNLQSTGGRVTEWIKGRVYYSHIPKLLSALGRVDRQIDEQAARLRELYAEAESPLPIVGDPIADRMDR